MIDYINRLDGNLKVFVKNAIKKSYKEQRS